MSKTILITGASSGFGKAIAEKFASEKWDCIITGRRKEKLDMLANELATKHNVSVLPLVFDVRNRDDVFNVLANRGERWKDVDVLVNNAGLAAGRDLFDEALLDDWDVMIDTNIKGLLYVSKAIIPSMIAKRQGTYH
jgi:NADP-dependent 3-hydroxy acid dehydrogenase YdfG